MIVGPAIRLFIAVAAFTLTFSGQVDALTVYDVIKLSNKNYSNQDIITLIGVTESAFTLKAEDIPRLKGLGVSETVIQAMLKATHIETQSESAPPQSNTLANSDHNDTADDHDDEALNIVQTVKVAPTHNESNKSITQKGFTSDPFKETAGGNHHHSVITLLGIQLFVLRDEGRYPSIATRGNAIAHRLEEAAAFGSGKFQPIHIADENAVMFSESHGARSVVIVSVSKDDAYTYQRRSGRQVSPELLAAYWSALLSDYWSIMITDESPSKLTNLHEGEALQALYERVTNLDTDDRLKHNNILQLFSDQQREHLLRLAISVPHEFNTRNLSKAHP